MNTEPSANLFAFISCDIYNVDMKRKITRPVLAMLVL